MNFLSPLNGVNADIDEGLPGIRQIGVQGPVHGHLGEQTNDTLLVRTLDNLLEAGGGRDTERVDANTSLTLQYLFKSDPYIYFWLVPYYWCIIVQPES